MKVFFPQKNTLQSVTLVSLSRFWSLRIRIRNHSLQLLSLSLLEIAWFQRSNQARLSGTRLSFPVVLQALFKMKLSWLRNYGKTPLNPSSEALSSISLMPRRSDIRVSHSLITTCFPIPCWQAVHPDIQSQGKLHQSFLISVLSRVLSTRCAETGQPMWWPEYVTTSHKIYTIAFGTQDMLTFLV